MKKNFLKSLALGVATLALAASCSMFKGDHSCDSHKCKGKKCSSAKSSKNSCSGSKSSEK